MARGALAIHQGRRRRPRCAPRSIRPVSRAPRWRSSARDHDFKIRARNGPERRRGGAEASRSGSRRCSTKAFGAVDLRSCARKSSGPGRRRTPARRVLAILVSFVVTLVYLALRFEWRFGLAAVLATMHDILATIAFIKLLNLEVSLTVIAAMLTVIGYSLNDTIIIFDRVRENLRKTARERCTTCSTGRSTKRCRARC